MTNGQDHHQPVMLEEVLIGLNIKADGHYLDGTFGRGGHARAILGRLSASGSLLVMDRDPQAITVAEQGFGTDERLLIRQGSFDQMSKHVQELGWMGQMDGILLDLGVSSPQLDDPQRGFSFQQDGPLDMRMDPNTGQSAAQWLARASVQDIARVLKEYGEERYARRIAKSIVQTRGKNPITRTRQLADIIAAASPSWEQDKHPATRSFQAIRIFINDELQALKTCLSRTVELLRPAGRLVVISFHSLEDRIVKRFIQAQVRGDDFPVDLPVTHEQLKPRMRAIGKASHPDEREISSNPRARSAVLRIAERLG